MSDPSVPTPPTQPPDPAWLPATPVIIEHPWQPTPHVPADVPMLAPSGGAPVNVDAPFIQQSGAVIMCTMGNWGGEPTSYAYQWRLDGTTDIGTDINTYVIVDTDVGHVVACIVAATNAIGTTTGPPSNDVTVTTPTTTQGATIHGNQSAGNHLDPFDGSSKYGPGDNSEAAV